MSAVTVNDMVVEDAAAYLFWTLAENTGVSDAINLVLETNGQCLLTQVFSNQILNEYALDKLDIKARQAFLNAVVEKAFELTVEERNLLGTTYAEDAQTCRSPSASQVDALKVKAIPIEVMRSIPIEKIGRLCLRHPLPAVVFSNTKPCNENIIEIEDTVSALGFQLPMFLDKHFQCQKINDDLFVLTGIFSIPVPNAAYSKAWNHVIQNSTRFFNQSSLVAKDWQLDIEVGWPTVPSAAR